LDNFSPKLPATNPPIDHPEFHPVVYPSSVSGPSSFDTSSVAGSPDGSSLFVVKITVRPHRKPSNLKYEWRCLRRKNWCRR